jgi:hypothetical protein
MRSAGIFSMTLGLLAFGCGSGAGTADGTYHCATKGGQGHTACIEFTGLAGADLVSAQDGCGAGTWGSGLCARQGILGGCQLLPNQIDWYYAGGGIATSADVTNLCAAIGANFVDPPS